MTRARRQLGAWGERLAAEYLSQRGFHIIGRNLRTSLGEIDIVALEGDCLVFIEVRTKKSASFGAPEESFTPAKKERLVTLAQEYIQSHQDIPDNWRIDVVAVEINPQGQLQRIEHIANAIY
ncbi:MAG: YraN family protein [Chloroflexi bacterium]|nr:YraN family protein [Chloroflexota bacterium]